MIKNIMQMSNLHYHVELEALLESKSAKLDTKRQFIGFFFFCLEHEATGRFVKENLSHSQILKLTTETSWSFGV